MKTKHLEPKTDWGRGQTSKGAGCDVAAATLPPSPCPVRRHLSAITLALFALLCSCASLPPSPRVTPMRDEPLREELLHVLASSQPPAGRIRHHGILRIRGHEYVLDGYLVYSHGDGFRLRASDPMAATLLDVAETSRTTPLVFTDNIGLGRGRFLQGGPLRVARALTTIPDADRLDLGHESSGTLALSGGDWRFLFDPSSHVLAGMQCTKADSILLDIKVERSASFSRWEGPAPRLLKVRSYSPAYELTLEVLDVAPFPAARDYLERRVP